MAHKKGVGSSDNGRDSNSNRLGVKLFGGQLAKAGNILIRQRGTKWHPGEHVGMGRDHTIYALVDGIVTFDKRRKNRTFVSISPSQPVEERVARSAKPKKTEQKAAPVVKETVAAATPPPAAKAKAPAAPDTKASDDLKIVEGIGPKIAELLNNAGIASYAALAATDAGKIKEILTAAGNRYKAHDPTTWPQQAKMASEGKWDELKTWQDELDGGKVVASTEEE